MKKAAILQIVFILLVMVGVANALPVTSNDVWQNATVLTSGDYTSTPVITTNGSSIGGFFDGLIADYGSESGNSIFNDLNDNGVQKLYWKTASEVTIQSINLVAYHDFDEWNITHRGIRSFSLYYLDDDDNWISFYNWTYEDPGDLHYGGGPTYQFASEDMTRSFLELTANLGTAITAQYFKGEFVQYGDFGGSRIVELDAYGELQPVPEPATFLLFGFGLAGIAGWTRKFKKS